MRHRAMFQEWLMTMMQTQMVPMEVLTAAAEMVEEEEVMVAGLKHGN